VVIKLKTEENNNMKEVAIDTKTCSDEQGREHTFHYFLVVDQVPAGGGVWENYGVGVSEEAGECAVVRGITPLRGRIEELARLLADNAATPVNLPEVVADWL